MVFMSMTVISRSRSLSTTPICNRISVRRRSSGSGTAFEGFSTRASVISIAWLIRLNRISSFALEVVVEAALAELQRGGDIVHRGGVGALLLKQARGGAQDFLSGISGCLAGHGSQYTRGSRCGLATPLSSVVA